MQYHKFFGIILFVTLSTMIQAKMLTTFIGEKEVKYYVPDTVEALKQSTSTDSLSFRAIIHNPSPLPANYKPILSRLKSATDDSVLRATTNYFQINYIAAGQTDEWGELCSDFPQEAKDVFEYAAQIWSSYIATTVPITIAACWASFDGNTLGYSGSHVTANFEGGVANTNYSYSLANALSGSDLSLEHNDSGITYNSNFTWYFGVDGNTPSGEVDLLTIVLHEMAHSLNFSGGMNYTDGVGYLYPANGYPLIWDRFIVDSNNIPILNTQNNSIELGNLLTSNELYFSGINTNATNGGNKVKIYAPSIWKPGSSYAHLDNDTYKETENKLMVYAVNSGVAVHDPGDVALGILKDIGWTMIKSNVVNDIETNLMWQDLENTEIEYDAFIANEEAGKVLKWNSAVSYCENLILNGYSDWYLPLENELKSIVDISNSPTIKSIFNYSVKKPYWSSKEMNSEVSYGVSFYDGVTHDYYKTNSCYTRCVRKNPNNSSTMIVPILNYLLF